MGFWEGVKAGFYGGAGVDYYSMKNSELLEDIRDQGQSLGQPGFDSALMDPVDYLQALIPYATDLDQCLA